MPNTQSNRPPSVHFLKSIALSGDTLIVTGVPDEFDEGRPDITALFKYDRAKVTAPWSQDLLDFWTERLCTEPSGSGLPIVHGISHEGKFYSMYSPVVFETLPPGPPFKIISDIRFIGSHIYACGYGGQFYRRNAENDWTLLTELNVNECTILNDEYMKGLGMGDPKDIERLVQRANLLRKIQEFDFFRMNGLHDKEIYLAANEQLWLWDGTKAIRLPEFTEKHLKRASIAEILIEDDKTVWLCGDHGAFLKGNWRDGFTAVQGVPEDNSVYRSMAKFEDALYVVRHLYPEKSLCRFDGTNLETVETGLKGKVDINRIHAVEGVLWAVGHKDILRFDGNTWERIDHPYNEPIR